MGKRRLAYTVKKFQEGIYILAFVEGPGSVLKELERRLRVQELVISSLPFAPTKKKSVWRRSRSCATPRSRPGNTGPAAAAAAAQAAENAATAAAQAAEIAATAAAQAAEARR